MGPIALFDKSFLESLNVDEAVLFDYFFYPITCPIFYVETLGDLGKAESRGRRPEDVVGSLAFKSPQMHGGPNTFHRTLVVSNLMGQEVPMRGQIVVSNGIPVHVDGKRHVQFKPSPEREAFDRWQRGEFEQVERMYARQWREQLRILDLQLVAAQAANYGLDLSRCKTLQEAWGLAEHVISALPFDAQLRLAFDKFGLTSHERDKAMAAWARNGSQDLATFSPYAHFVLRLDVFFEIALATGKISTDRASNINDLAYLYYLPFCMVFVSSDKLHRACAPLFLRPEQEFIWGHDLKADLSINHDALMRLPEADRLRGLMALHPPPHPGTRIAQLHDRLMRKRQDGPFARASEKIHGEVAERIKRLNQAAESPTNIGPEFDPTEVDSITIERRIFKRRGSWYQVPHDLEPTDE